VLSGAALLGWFVLTRPDLSALIKKILPNLPLPALIFGGIVFSVVNAFVEEVVYRGVVFGGLVESGHSLAAILPLQAVAFGAIHMGGFPSGWIGVGLASIYGFLMGLIRLRSGGLLAPWAGHVLTDLVIVTIVFLTVRLQ
jgi:CAAX protease family protein